MPESRMAAVGRVALAVIVSAVLSGFVVWYIEQERHPGFNWPPIQETWGLPSNCGVGDVLRSDGTCAPVNCGMIVGPDHRWVWFEPDTDGTCWNPLVKRPDHFDSKSSVGTPGTNGPVGGEKR